MKVAGRNHKVNRVGPEIGSVIDVLPESTDIGANLSLKTCSGDLSDSFTFPLGCSGRSGFDDRNTDIR